MLCKRVSVRKFFCECDKDKTQMRALVRFHTYTLCIVHVGELSLGVRTQTMDIVNVIKNYALDTLRFIHPYFLEYFPLRDKKSLREKNGPVHSFTRKCNAMAIVCF